MADLLPGIAAKVIAAKEEKEKMLHSQRYSSLTSKRVGWSVLISLNLGMLFYIFLFAIQQSGAKQNAWLYSFLLWLVRKV